MRCVCLLDGDYFFEIPDTFFPPTLEDEGANNRCECVLVKEGLAIFLYRSLLNKSDMERPYAVLMPGDICPEPVLHILWTHYKNLEDTKTYQQLLDFDKEMYGSAPNELTLKEKNNSNPNLH